MKKKYQKKILDELVEDKRIEMREE